MVVSVNAKTGQVNYSAISVDQARLLQRRAPAPMTSSALSIGSKCLGMYMTVATTACLARRVRERP